ncbi:MAG: hypothetical protein MZU97_14215 [Bacillus subtilis]|nr:hypothetical protein [Bacillus subtilis]
MLIILFSFFYSFILINPEKTAENLQKQNAYIPGRPSGQRNRNPTSRRLCSA